MDPPLRTDSGGKFRQQLFLLNASVVVESAVQGVRIELFVDANAPALRLRALAVGDRGAAFRLHASLELWRTGLATGQGSFCSAWNRSGDALLSDKDVAQSSSPSSAASFSDNEAAIGVVHVNHDDVSAALIQDTLSRQGIDMKGAPIYNPMHGRTFGAWVSGT